MMVLVKVSLSQARFALLLATPLHLPPALLSCLDWVNQPRAPCVHHK